MGGEDQLAIRRQGNHETCHQPEELLTNSVATTLVTGDEAAEDEQTENSSKSAGHHVERERSLARQVDGEQRRLALSKRLRTSNDRTFKTAANP